jgi:hypothetical protein
MMMQAQVDKNAAPCGNLESAMEIENRSNWTRNIFAEFSANPRLVGGLIGSPDKVINVSLCPPW